MKLLSENAKLDIAIVPASINGASTGPYYSMKGYRKALFVVELGAMDAGVTSAIQVMQAQDAGGTAGKVVTNNAATVTANTKVTGVLIANGAVHVAGDKITINGLTYTAAADDGGADSRTYAVGANAAASAAALAAKINSAAVGVPGVTATVGAGSAIELTVDNPGETTITISVSDNAVAVPSTVSAIAYVECDSTFLDDANGFDHIALRVTNSAATQTGAILIRGEGRYTPVQQVAAAKTDVQP